MPFRHSVRFGAFRGLPLRRAAHGGRKGRLLIALGLLTLLAILAFSLYLRSLSSSMAISDAKDAVALAINGCVSRIIQENNYGSNYFVKLEKDAEGNITAITTDTMHINELSSQLLSEIARAAEAGGADALSMINTLTAMKIDVARRTFALANRTGGLSGPAIHPVAVRMVYQCARAVKIPIIGMGGIRTAEDALEMIMAGASAVAVGTVSFHDQTAALSVIEGIREYLERYQVPDVRDLIGCVG